MNWIIIRILLIFDRLPTNALWSFFLKNIIYSTHRLGCNNYERRVYQQLIMLVYNLKLRSSKNIPNISKYIIQLIFAKDWRRHFIVHLHLLSLSYIYTNIQYNKFAFNRIHYDVLLDLILKWKYLLSN